MCIHFAIMPELTDSIEQMVDFLAYKYFYTEVAALFVYGLFQLFLTIFKSSSENLSFDDWPTFFWMAVSTLTLYAIANFIFHWNIIERDSLSFKEQQTLQQLHEKDEEVENPGVLDYLKTVKSWLLIEDLYPTIILQSMTVLARDFLFLYLALYASKSVNIKELCC